MQTFFLFGDDSNMAAQFMKEANKVLTSMEKGVHEVRDRVTQIVTATNEQYIVCEDINKNVTEVSDESEKALKISKMSI